MRKLIFMFFLLIGVVVLAQEPLSLGKADKKMTPEQEAELRAKNLDLQLDLTDAQYKNVKELELKWSKERADLRKERQEMKMEKDEKMKVEKFQRDADFLDREIKHQEEMKKILNPDQYEKWKNMREEKMKESKKHIQDKKRQQKNKGC